MMISPQAKTLLVVQLIQMLAVLVAVLIAPVSMSAKAWSVVSILIFMGLGAWLTFYSINCMVYGSCDVFAWIIVGVVLVFFVLAVVSALIGVATSKTLQGQLTPIWNTGVPVIPSVQVKVSEHKEEEKKKE
jgi:hypothetical protein